MPKGITSTEGYIRKIFALAPPAGTSLFYRGHSDSSYKLIPSLFRSPSHLKSEHLLFRELLVSNPYDFQQDSSTLDKLVRMQHHSLPTRLLDLTSNPLIALYFACASRPDKIGEVITFKIKSGSIKFFDSDTASILANLARLDQTNKNKLDLNLTIPKFNELESAKRLLHFIREEKPYFTSDIKPRDIGAVLTVRTRFNNSRISSQSGAFLLFGKDASLNKSKDFTIERMSINPAQKSKILTELDRLNINNSTVFPYIENSAKHISNKYAV